MEYFETRTLVDGTPRGVARGRGGPEGGGTAARLWAADGSSFTLKNGQCRIIGPRAAGGGELLRVGGVELHVRARRSDRRCGRKGSKQPPSPQVVARRLHHPKHQRARREPTEGSRVSKSINYQLSDSLVKVDQLLLKVHDLVPRK